MLFEMVFCLMGWGEPYPCCKRYSSENDDLQRKAFIIFTRLKYYFGWC